MSEDCAGIRTRPLKCEHTVKHYCFIVMQIVPSLHSEQNENSCFCPVLMPRSKGQALKAAVRRNSDLWLFFDHFESLWQLTESQRQTTTRSSMQLSWEPELRYWKERQKFTSSQSTHGKKCETQVVAAWTQYLRTCKLQLKVKCYSLHAVCSMNVVSFFNVFKGLSNKNKVSGTKNDQSCLGRWVGW